MKKLLIIPFILFTGCASAKAGFLSGLFTAKVADEVKLADTIKGADKITGVEKVADKAEATATGQAGMTNTVKTSIAGRDMTQSKSTYNDSGVMKDYIKLMRYIIYALCAIVTGQFMAMIGLIGWVVKFLLREASKQDDRIEKYLTKERKV